MAKKSMFKAVMRKAHKERQKYIETTWKRQDLEFRKKWNDMTEKEYVAIQRAKDKGKIRTFGDADKFMEELRKGLILRLYGKGKKIISSLWRLPSSRTPLKKDKEE